MRRKFLRADRRELRPLARRVLSVTADRLQALSRAESKYVIAVAGVRQKITAICGALNGRFLNVLITDEDTALTLGRHPSPLSSPPRGERVG